MLALLLDLENLTHRSFVGEAYRTVERAHGKRPDLCLAFGSKFHVDHTRELAMQLGIQLITTAFAEKNAADIAMVQEALKLAGNKYGCLVIGSGDRGFVHWLRKLPAQGVRLECISRTHQLCKEADGWYAQVYRMDAKRMHLPTDFDLRSAAIDCVPQIQTGPVRLEVATSLMRSFRIVPKSTPGKVFFGRHESVFRLDPAEEYLELV